MLKKTHTVVDEYVFEDIEEVGYENGDMEERVTRKAKIMFRDRKFNSCKFDGVRHGNYSLDDWNFLSQIADFIVHFSDVKGGENEQLKS